MMWDHPSPVPLSLSPSLCEAVKQGGFIPEAVPTRQVIQHSSPLKSNGVQSGLGSPGAQASLNQPVHQVAALKHTLTAGLGVFMEMEGWARSKTTLV